ncbi:hypothetical protein HYALB_00012930 [Hymenoscyphus albidus]|uniref:Uncharacterized protein n=1 Tax=Hymenoscyphus albidus TaxID=595503 RepID=A0A9N9QAR7_9HELO|nr:hypothetical protein HYALB_00012930 [Hymenoscyphus albidus]
MDSHSLPELLIVEPTQEGLILDQPGLEVGNKLPQLQDASQNIVHALSTNAKGRRIRICGIKRRTFVMVVTFAIIVSIVAIVAGAVTGTRERDEQRIPPRIGVYVYSVDNTIIEFVTNDFQNFSWKRGALTNGKINGMEGSKLSAAWQRYTDLYPECYNGFVVLYQEENRTLKAMGFNTSVAKSTDGVVRWDVLPDIAFPNAAPSTAAALIPLADLTTAKVPNLLGLCGK